MNSCSIVNRFTGEEWTQAHIQLTASGKHQAVGQFLRETYKALSNVQPMYEKVHSRWST